METSVMKRSEKVGSLSPREVHTVPEIEGENCDG